jgi:PPOX class probable F420-dependent enzyme
VATLSDDVLGFLESMKAPAVLVTLASDGTPRASAVWFGVLDGDIVVSTPAGRPKALNALADGRVSIIVDTKERPYRGVAIEGVAEVMDDPDRTVADLIARRYLGDDLAELARRRALAVERVVIRIRPRRVRPWNLGARPQ